MKVGDELTLAHRRDLHICRWLFTALALLCGGVVAAQTLYKYRGDNGEWIYSDRPPDGGEPAEVRGLNSRVQRSGLTIDHQFTGNALQFIARNQYHAPMEVGLEFDRIEGVDYPHPDQALQWVVQARSERVLLNLPSLNEPAPPSVEYRFFYLPGDPEAVPVSDLNYRVPFAVGTSFPITQAYPNSVTHRTRDSMYAIDVAMPIGTDIVAARGGIVFDIAGTNSKGGPDAQEYADLANIVRILHDDGTYALYAHLNWNSIRVLPGDRVEAGQYIADSGNTGFSSGPHLHFAVQRNMGMRVDSIPVTFRGANGANVVPATGTMLTARP